MAMVEAMLEASARILDESGLDAMTTNAVAERAGVSVGSLYQYFPNRDAILVALMERFEVDMQARMERALNEDRLENGLGSMVQAALAHHFDRQVVAVILEAEEQRFGIAARPVLADAEQQMSEFIRKFVRARSMRDDDEVERVAHRMEIVGRALVDDALRRFDRSASLANEICAVIRACAPPGFWTDDSR